MFMRDANGKALSSFSLPTNKSLPSALFVCTYLYARSEKMKKHVARVMCRTGENSISGLYARARSDGKGMARRAVRLSKENFRDRVPRMILIDDDERKAG